MSVKLNTDYAVVPLTFPVDHAATLVSDIISLKNYSQAEIYFMTAAAFTKTAAVTMQQGNAVDSCATALGFTRYYETGMMLNYDGASTTVAAASLETAQGAGGADMTILEDTGKTLIEWWDDVTAFVDNEVLTFSGGKTAVVDGIRYNEDIMLQKILAVGVNTFNVTQVLDVNKIYMIPITSAMLAENMDCIELNIADMDSPTLLAAWAILSDPRFATQPMPTAIYD